MQRIAGTFNCLACLTRDLEQDIFVADCVAPGITPTTIPISEEAVSMSEDYIRSAMSALAAMLLTVGISVAQTALPSTVPAYLDPSQPLTAPVDDLVSKMTLEEKASQLVNQARAIPRSLVPAYAWPSEALHGLAHSGTITVFPEPMGHAAPFDAPLIHS